MLKNPKVVIGLVALAAIVIFWNVLIPFVTSLAPTGGGESAIPAKSLSPGSNATEVDAPDLSAEAAIVPDFDSLGWVEAITRDPFDKFRDIKPVKVKRQKFVKKPTLKKKPAAPQPPRHPKYKLKAILNAKENPVALIDKMVVKVGEKIGNDLLVAINEDHVIVNVAGHKFKLNIWEEPLW